MSKKKRTTKQNNKFLDKKPEDSFEPTEQPTEEEIQAAQEELDELEETED